jgi:MFS family permease
MVVGAEYKAIRERLLGMDNDTSWRRRFAWLWAGYAISTAGTFIAFDAFPLIAILVLHAGPAGVSALRAVGLAVGAIVAVPIAPLLERRRKRPAMIAADLIRFVAFASVPLAFGFGWLSFAQLLLVSVITGAADIAFRAASGAYLKTLLPQGELLTANARFEQTLWTATILGPPLGGAAFALFGPVITVIANAVSFLLSALAIRAIGGDEAQPAPTGTPRLRAADVFEGWRYIFAHPTLRPLFFNTIMVNGLIMATAPLLAVLMLGQLGFAPWQYGLAFGLPCVGGVIGARFVRPLIARVGGHKVMRAAGSLRACWSIGLAFIQPGIAGLLLVLAIQFGLLVSIGVFNPVLATYRLEHTDADRIARVLSAWSVTSNATIAVLTALWGLLAGLTGPRTAIASAGLLMLLSPFLLPREVRQSEQERLVEAT